MASDTYHEPLELLSGETRDMHRAIVSLMEELAAIDCEPGAPAQHARSPEPANPGYARSTPTGPGSPS